MSNRNRDITLDLMKSLLVIGMITAHVVQLCYVGGSKLVALFSLFINVVTFSSFMFCFGCASWLAYFRKYQEKAQIKGKLFRNFIRLLICFYISGYGFLWLVDSDFSLSTAAKVLVLWKIPGYSEFLLSFAFLNIVIYGLYRIIRSTIVNKYKMGGVIFFSLLSTFMPYGLIIIPVLGVFVGSTKFACFPILQYFPFFLVGLYCQRFGKFGSKKLWLLACLSTLSSFIYILFTCQIPVRFPPSLFWILWASAFTLLYYQISSVMGGWMKNSRCRILADVFGAYTLDYLVISNLMIFALRNVCGKTFEWYECCLWTFIILVVCYLYGFYKLRKKNAQA